MNRVLLAARAIFLQFQTLSLGFLVFLSRVISGEAFGAYQCYFISHEFCLLIKSIVFNLRVRVKFAGHLSGSP